MKAINHQTAQRMIYARLDGALEAAASARLDAHLQDCAECRRFAAQAMEWNVALRHTFHAHRPAPTTLSAPAVLAIYDRVATSRAKMKKSYFFNLTETAAFVLLFVLLASGLILALTNPNLRSSLSPLAQPEASATALPTATQPPTATPLPPWTKESPAVSAAEIVPALEELTQKNMQRWMTPGWIHAVVSDAGKAGTIQTYSNESWSRYATGTGACPEGLTIVTDQPGSENILQMQATLADGRYGNLLSLRKGEDQVQQTSYNCPPLPESTTAGFLARRMSGDPSAVYKGSAGEKLSAVSAWYEQLDGETVLVVSVDFDTPNNITPRTVETYWFDNASGLEVQHNMIMLQANGNQTGETFSRTEYEFLETLPAEDLEKVNAALAELNALAENPVVLATATPVPASAVAGLRDLAYTRDDPLEDRDEILAVLNALRQQHLETLAKPGWYLYGRGTPIEGEIENRYNLLHVLEGGQCEMFVYYYQLPEGRIATNQIILSDGTTGSADIRKAVIEQAGPGEAPCSPKMLDSLAELSNEIDFFGDFGGATADTAYQAWVETIAGRKVFVLYYDIHYQAPKPTTMDPDTRAFEAEDRSQQWAYYDLASGASLGGYYQIALENGKILGEPPGALETLPYELTYLPTPPADIQAAYDKALQELQALLSKGS